MMVCDSLRSGYRATRSHIAKTYEMVNDPSTDSIISWSESGKSNPQEFSKDVLPKVFVYDNFSLFTGMLDGYGFKKVDSERLEFAEDGFVRGKPELLRDLYGRVRERELNSEEGRERQKKIEEMMKQRRRILKEMKTIKKTKRMKKDIAKELVDQLKQLVV